MKKLFILTVMSTLLYSCGNMNVEQKESETNLGYTTNLTIIKIEGCEYFFGDWGNATVLTHKGNCTNPIHKIIKSE